MRPYREFSGSEGDYSVDDRGPEFIKADLDKLFRMFNPLYTHPDGTHGGIGLDNLNFDWEPAAAESIAEWLDEHPEATTTVQDGVVSMAKLNPALQLLLSQLSNKGISADDDGEGNVTVVFEVK